MYMNTNPLADDKQAGGISKPITIISVTALHIINSNAVNVGEGHKRGSESLLFLPLSHVCLFAMQVLDIDWSQ